MGCSLCTIQIQHLLKLNMRSIFTPTLSLVIQIQHLLKLNIPNCNYRITKSIIQIQHLLKLNYWRINNGQF